MSEMRILENERLCVRVSDHGAELCSIYDKKEKREVIWTADPGCLTLLFNIISQKSFI